LLFAAAQYWRDNGGGVMLVELSKMELETVQQWCREQEHEHARRGRYIDAEHYQLRVEELEKYNTPRPVATICAMLRALVEAADDGQILHIGTIIGAALPAFPVGSSDAIRRNLLASLTLPGAKL
jgi:hypothetical protein